MKQNIAYLNMSVDQLKIVIAQVKENSERTIEIMQQNGADDSAVAAVRDYGLQSLVEIQDILIKKLSA